MSYLIRQAHRDDLPRLEKLLGDYMRETYRGAWGGTAGRLDEHLSGDAVKISVAEATGREVIALISWVPTYDLHWCLKGGDVIDLFVCPAHRSRGVAVLLLAGVAAEVERRGGAFIKGGAVDDTVVRRLYGRFAVCHPGGECYVSGRAFRRLAELWGKSPREAARMLPEPGWNFEP